MSAMQCGVPRVADNHHELDCIDSAQSRLPHTDSVQTSIAISRYEATEKVANQNFSFCYRSQTPVSLGDRLRLIIGHISPNLLVLR